MLRDGFFRVAAVTPKIRVADCAHNAGSILRAAEEAAEKGANAAVFPELCLTGYTCGDLVPDGNAASGGGECLAEANPGYS